jgi:Tol biopolymer transport system component
MKSDRFEVLDRLAPLLDAPEPSIEGFLRRRDRRRRNQRILAGVVGVALFVVPVALIAVLSSRDRTPTPGARETEPAPAVIDQAFVDSINSCERLLVTRQHVEAALGFYPEYVAPFAAGKSRPGAAQIESGGGVTVGCQYVKQGTGGEVVVTAYTADAPPRPLDTSQPVLGIGDEAEFSPYGNRDSHAIGAEGATSILQVRSSYLILRFNGRRVDTEDPNRRLLPLRQLAEHALTTVDRTTGVGAPEVDYMFDLNTRVMTPLPGPIIRSRGETAESGRYAASSDGSLLAYVGTGDEGTPQIFIAGADGTGVRQMTHDPTGAASPAWSPDGTRVAYEGYGSGDVRNIFVLDVATGDATQITDETRNQCPSCPRTPQFTPDGSSLLYNGGTDVYPVVRIVPVAGGESTILFGRGRGGMGGAGYASLSPDGSLVTMMGHEPGGPGAGRFVANSDGTELRNIPGRESNPAGTWSPDGSRIVCQQPNWRNSVVVVDIATGDESPVAQGREAIWLDDHTLLVSV